MLRQEVKVKKFLSIFLILVLVFGISACSNVDDNTASDIDGVALTDVDGNAVYLSNESRVVCCYASFAECWQLSGLEPIAVTKDAVDEHGLKFKNDVEIIGTVKNIDLEKVVSCEPDYVMLSADLTAHLSLKSSLEQMNIEYGYFRVDVFDDYKALMRQFCNISGREDLFRENVTDVETRIAEIKAKVPQNTELSVLLIRAFSTGMKAKTDDNLAGQILKEFGLKNIADFDASILEDLSIEHIINADPDCIFAFTMGDEIGATEFLKRYAENNPAWSGLSAVQNGNYHMLPKELFHYKPNNRWDESYEYLAKLIWPTVFSAES